MWKSKQHSLKRSVQCGQGARSGPAKGTLYSIILYARAFSLNIISAWKGRVVKRCPAKASGLKNGVWSLGFALQQQEMTWWKGSPERGTPGEVMKSKDNSGWHHLCLKGSVVKTCPAKAWGGKSGGWSLGLALQQQNMTSWKGSPERGTPGEVMKSKDNSGC